MTWLIILTVLCALAFDFTNGFHDTANAIATSVSTRALSPRIAIVVACTLNLFGALTFTGVAKSIAGKIADPFHVHHGIVVVLVAVLCAITWNLITWYFGIPSSSSHALIGGLTGAVIGAAGFQAINPSGFSSTIQALVFSPIAALLLGYILMWILRLLFGNRSPYKVNRYFRSLQPLTTAFQAYMHGSNDSQKTMGIITFALVAGGYQTSLDVPLWVKVSCAITMALGTSVGGWRIIKTVGSKIIKLEPVNGFASDLTSATVILTATLAKLPVSSTHVISSAIMGTGAAKRFRQVNWGIAGRIVISWLITIPLTGLLACVVIKIVLWCL